MSPHLRQWYGTFWLYSTGLADEARQQTARVIEEDPLCQMWHDALESVRKSVDLDPNFWLGHLGVGVFSARRGEHAEAMHCAETVMRAAPWGIALV